MELDRVIKERRSVKKFKEKKPDWRKIIECIDSMRYSPMAGGIFSLKFILVDDKETIKKLADAAQQPFVAQVHYVVVVCSNPSRTTNAYGDRGEMYLRQQAGAAIQNFLLKVQGSGLATVWIGHFVEEIVKRALKIPDEINVEAFFPIGYSFEKKPSQKKRINLDSVLYFNCYGKEKMREPQSGEC